MIYALPLISTDIDWQISGSVKCGGPENLAKRICKVFLSHSIHFDAAWWHGEVASLWILTCLRPFWFKVEAEARLRPGWGLENSACLQAFLSSFTPCKSLQLNANSDSDSILKPTLRTPAAAIAYFQDGKCGAIRSALITSHSEIQVMWAFGRHCMGVSENRLVPHCTQWFCWSLSLLNCYFIGNIPFFSDKPVSW